MLVVEGPDNSGKTTFCKDLAKHFDLAQFKKDHTVKPDDDLIRDRIYGAIEDEVRAEVDCCVFDRLFFSEVIYGPVLRGHCIFPYVEQSHILALLAAIDTPVIFCLPPFEVVSKNIYGRDQLEGVVENLQEIYRQYVLLAKMCSRSGQETFAHWLEFKATGAGPGGKYLTHTGPEVLHGTHPGFVHKTPRVIVYDYTRPKTRTRVYAEVQKYLNRRGARTAWQSQSSTTSSS